MWAINELMTARLQTTASESGGPGRRTRLSQVTKAVLSSFLSQPVQSPTAILAVISQHDTGRPDEVSRVLGELLAEEVVVPTEPELGSDRRMKYFALSEKGRMAAAEQAAHVFSGGALRA